MLFGTSLLVYVLFSRCLHIVSGYDVTRRADAHAGMQGNAAQEAVMKLAGDCYSENPRGASTTPPQATYAPAIHVLMLFGHSRAPSWGGRRAAAQYGIRGMAKGDRGDQGGARQRLQGLYGSEGLRERAHDAAKNRHARAGRQARG